METASLQQHRIASYSSSYRTYEEWKRNWADLATYSNISSYRTYEEWKPSGISEAQEQEQGSYRTYEEWKLVTKKGNLLLKKVLTVPMRNGN